MPVKEQYLIVDVQAETTKTGTAYMDNARIQHELNYQWEKGYKFSAVLTWGQYSCRLLFEARN